MCTVSWTRREDRFELFCNRDELRTRQMALEPRVEQQRGVHYLAPVDGDRGGTWLCANEYGVVLCLLNGACLGGNPEGWTAAEGIRSRGCIPLELADVTDSPEALARLSKMDLTVFAPFTLAVADPDLPVGVAEWTGKELAILPYGEPYAPLISSSVESVEVRARRREVYAEQVKPGDHDAFERFHQSHAFGLSAYSPCMHRPDAETVSHSIVVVNERQIEFQYSAGSPCRGVTPVVRTLERIA